MRLWPNSTGADQAAEEFINIAEGHGCRVADDRGASFFDCRVSSAAVLLGQCGAEAPDPAAAISGQLGMLEYATLFRGSNRPAQDLAAGLARAFGPAYGRVFLSSTASEAMETALKMARQYHKLAGETGRGIVLSVRGGHHGQMLGGLAASSSAQAARCAGPKAPAFVAVDLPEGAEAEALGRAIADIGPGRIAAMVAQPVMPWAACRSFTAATLSGMAAAVQAAGGLFILDEAFSAFGRVAHPGVCAAMATAPDLVCVGAALSNGAMPVAATLAGEGVFGRFTAGDPEPCFEHGCTNAGHPVACAAANAALPFLERANRQSCLADRRGAFEQAMRGTAARHGLVNNGSGFLQGLSRKGKTDDSAWAEAVRSGLRGQGFLVSSLDGAVVICPPIVSTHGDIAGLRDALERVCAACRGHDREEAAT